LWVYPTLLVPGLPSVAGVSACSVGQGQGPSHLTASCLLLKHACCSSLHCRRKVRLGDGGFPWILHLGPPHASHHDSNTCQEGSSSVVRGSKPRKGGHREQS
jgi:hypothetical protein